MEFIYPEKYEEYYRLKDRDKRRAVLENLENEKDDFYNYVLKVNNLRYRQSKEGKKDRVLDYFIRGWVLSAGIKGSGKGFGSRSSEKKLYEEIKDCWCIKDTGFNKDFDQAYYNEFVNMAALYIDLCMNDRTYGSTLFGMMRVKEEKIIEKIAVEIYHVFYAVPEKMQETEKTGMQREAAEEAFNRAFPDNYHILNNVILNKGSYESGK